MQNKEIEVLNLIKDSNGLSRSDVGRKNKKDSSRDIKEFSPLSFLFI